MRGRRYTYTSLWILALAYGFLEAAVVVYLREIYAREVSMARDAASFAALQVTLVSLPNRLVTLEMAREVCTILILGAVAWLAGRRIADRIGAFLLAFGVWDLTYYGTLQLVLRWPDSLNAWDILFLIPLPWVAPVWAPVIVAFLFVVAGSYLFWTADRDRQYGWLDVVVLAASVLLTLAAFLGESAAVIDHRMPEQFPVGLFWTGVGLGLGWFVHAERRGSRSRVPEQPWVGVSVRTLVPESGDVPSAREEGPVGTPQSRDDVVTDVQQIALQYTEAIRRRDALINRAAELGERFDRLGHGLTSHPDRTIIGLPDPRVPAEVEWDVIASHPLPPIESLAALTDDIRAAERDVEQLRDRLILTGRRDIVEEPDHFYQ